MKRHFRTFTLGFVLCLFLPRPSQGQGAGGVGNDNPTGVTGEYNGSVTTAGSYDPYTGNAKRFIDDLTVTGSLGAYPLKWTRILNTRGASGLFGHGGGWRHSYAWGLHIAPPPSGNPCQPEYPSATVAFPDGRTMAFYLEGQSFERRDGGEPGDRLVHAEGGAATDYDLKLKDGGRVEFRTIHGHPSSPQYIVDPYGQKTTLEYISDGLYVPLRLFRITEPGGRYLEVNYHVYPAAGNYPACEVIEHVKAYDGPQAHLVETVGYAYEPVEGSSFRFFNLKYANYDDGNHATYDYEPPSPTVFSQWSYVPGKLRTCDDVRYPGAMKKIKYEYVSQTNSVACPIAWGQIKGEKNPATDQYISQVDYPSHTTCIGANMLKRTEMRPDGATRVFEYSLATGGPELESYTDFAYPGQSHHTTTINYDDVGPQAPNDHYLRIVTNARPGAFKTKTHKEGKIGAVMAVIHPNGFSSIKYEYTDLNNPSYVASRTDENNKTTYYDRYPATHPDNPNRVWQIRYPDGGFETFTYNGFGQVLEHRMTSGGLEVFTYSRGLKQTYKPPATLSDLNPQPTEYLYYDITDGRADRIDRLKSVKDPLGHITTYDYNMRGQVTSVKYHDQTITESRYNPDGTLEWVEDEFQHKTSYLYDEYKRVTSVKNPLFEETVNSYAPDGHHALSHTTSSVYLTTLPSGKTIKQDYDSNFRVKEKTLAPGTPEAATTTYTYDEVGNQITITEPNGQAGGDFAGAYSYSVYDDRNRRTSVTDALNHTTSWIYDEVGNMKQETRADQKVRTWDEHDAMNRIKHTTGFLGAQEQTSYIYDFAGNLLQMTDCKGAVYYYTYDHLNRKESATYPLDASNTTTVGRYELWRYDAAENLKAYKNPAGQWKHFEYDVRNRQIESYWNGSQGSDIRDVSIGDRTVTDLDPAGRVESITTWNTNAVTYVGYGYDNASRKTLETQSLGGAPGWPGALTRLVQTLPDIDGNRGTLTVAGAYSLTYDYTQRQQLAHINKVGQVNSGQFFEYRYDKNGNLRRRQNLLQGLDSTVFKYDQGNRVLLCIQTGQDNVPFAVSDYNDYDELNRVKSISRQEDQYKGESFEYDFANQLSSVSYRVEVGERALPATAEPGMTLGPMTEVDKDYDREAFAIMQADPVREPLAAVGTGDPDPDAYTGDPRTVTYTNDAINRTRMNNNNETTTDYTPNGLNQYTAVSGYTGSAAPHYDDNFNLSGFAGWEYVYDADNRLISAEGHGHIAQFVYDALGRCVRRTIDSVATVFTYDEWKPIVEWTGTGAFVAWNLYGPGADEILVRYQPDTAPGSYIHVHYHLDAMGNVQFLLSETNLGLEKYTYDAFGRPRITGWGADYRATSNYGNRFLFTGREYLYTLGLYDYRHRVYHPGLGRFMQVDPIGFKGDAMNLYRYCGSNPIFHSDPMGLVSNFGPNLRHYWWDTAKYMDSENNFQGGLQDYWDRLGRDARETRADGGGARSIEDKNQWGKAQSFTSKERLKIATEWIHENNPELDPRHNQPKLAPLKDKYGETSIISGKITLDPNQIRSVAGYVQYFSHELMHAKDGLLGRLLTRAFDPMGRHPQIVRESKAIADKFVRETGMRYVEPVTYDH